LEKDLTRLTCYHPLTTRSCRRMLQCSFSANLGSQSREPMVFYQRRRGETSIRTAKNRGRIICWASSISSSNFPSVLTLLQLFVLCVSSQASRSGSIEGCFAFE
jgi:hypothetical protein